MMRIENLKPCPFCGGDPEIFSPNVIMCKKCGVMLGQGFKKEQRFRNKRAAIAAWNKRKPMERIEDAIADLMEMHDCSRNSFDQGAYCVSNRIMEIIKEEMRPTFMSGTKNSG